MHPAKESPSARSIMLAPAAVTRSPSAWSARPVATEMTWRRVALWLNPVADVGHWRSSLAVDHRIAVVICSIRV